jgi:transcription initiation factor TFIIB
MTKQEKYVPSSIHDVNQCPECGGVKLMRDYESAEVVCMECGYVLDIKITDQGPEWRAFNTEQIQKRARTGAPATFTIHDKGLSTMIDYQDHDVHGKKFAHGQKAQIYRLRKWQRRIRVSDSMERNLAFALTEITKVANNLNLPKNIFETASVIYRKAVKQRLIRGRSIQGISAASVYIACRQCGLSRTLEEISKASNLSKRDVGRSYSFLVKELEYFVPPIRANQYLSKFSNQLSMQSKVEEIANKILVTASNLKLTSGRGPTGIAAAASYIASVLVGERRTQREIAEIAKVTEVTIRNRYKELVDKLIFVMEL